MRSGDTPHGGKPALVDTTGEVTVKPKGSTVRTDPEPALVDAQAAPRPTAGDLRAAGYSLPAEVDDGEVPSRYVADTPTPPGEVRLVEDTSAPDDGLTPLERYAREAEAATEAE